MIKVLLVLVASIVTLFLLVALDPAASPSKGSAHFIDFDGRHDGDVVTRYGRHTPPEQRGEISLTSEFKYSDELAPSRAVFTVSAHPPYTMTIAEPSEVKEIIVGDYHYDARVLATGECINVGSL